MTNLTLLELAAIALALDEEGAERKRRRWAVHPAWSKREIEGFLNEQRMFFCSTQESEPVIYKTTNEISKPITPKERLALCIR